MNRFILAALPLILLACASASGNVCEVANEQYAMCYGEDAPIFPAQGCDMESAEAFLTNGCSTEEEHADEHGEQIAAAEDGKTDGVFGMGQNAADLFAVANGSLNPPHWNRLGAFRGALNSGPGTVGRGAAGCIAGIYMLWGEDGQRDIGNIFNSGVAQNLLRAPNWDDNAHRQLAQLEYDYWVGQHAQRPDFYTGAAVRVSVNQRVWLQKAMGNIADIGSLIQTGFWRLNPFFR